MKKKLIDIDVANILIENLCDEYNISYGEKYGGFAEKLSKIFNNVPVVEADVIKLFVSYSAIDKTRDEIISECFDAVQDVKQRLALEDPIYQVVIQVINDITDDNCDNPIIQLAKDIEKLSKADIIYFSKNWDENKNCRIEFDIAKKYNIKTIFQEEDLK